MRRGQANADLRLSPGQDVRQGSIESDAGEQQRQASEEAGQQPKNPLLTKLIVDLFPDQDSTLNPKGGMNSLELLSQIRRPACQPCSGPRASVFRTRRSSVPWRESLAVRVALLDV